VPKPADVLGITGGWKLQLGVPGKSGIQEVRPSDLAKFELAPWFTVAGDWAQVRVSVNAGTTSGSTYPRCELRQMKPGSSDEAAWDSKTLDCWFEYELMPTRLPAKKPQMCVLQLHDDRNDLLEVIYQRNTSGGYELTQRVGGSAKGQPLVPHALNKAFVLALGIVKGMPTIYRDGVPILTTAKMPQSSKTYAKLLNYLQSNAKTDAASEYGEILARNVRSGLGAYPGPLIAPGTPAPVPPPAQTLGVGGIATPPGAVLATADTIAPLTITKPGVYDGGGHTCGHVTVKASGVTVQNYRVAALNQYSVMFDGDDVTIQNNDLAGVKPSGDGDLNAITGFGQRAKLRYNSAVNFVTDDPGGSHTDFIQHWVSASHPKAGKDWEIVGNKATGPANPKRDPKIPSIHQFLMVEGAGQGGNTGGTGKPSGWLIADNEIGDSWNQAIKLDGVQDFVITRNRFVGSSDHVLEVTAASTGVTFLDDNVVGPGYGSVGVPVTAGSGQPAPAPAPTPSRPKRVVIVLRHAEKPSDASDHTLNAAGRARAEALADLFTSGQLPAGLWHPDRLIASKGGTPSERPRQTMQPLADRGHLPLNLRYDAERDYKVLGPWLAARLDVTMVCLEHSAIIDTCKGLGKISPSMPKSWPSSRFDVFWVFTSDDGKTWKFTQIPELLMPGDKSTTL
jgi:hypothetical protein